MSQSIFSNLILAFSNSSFVVFKFSFAKSSLSTAAYLKFVNFTSFSLLIKIFSGLRARKIIPKEWI